MKVRIPANYGAQNRENMMNKINNLQNEMAEKQQELQEKEYTANAGGGVVSATVNGAHSLVKLALDKSVVDPDDTEMLSDLIIAAVNEAEEAAQKDYDDTMAELTGSLNIPGLSGLLG